MLGRTNCQVTIRFAHISCVTARTFVLIYNIRDEERRERFFMSKHRVYGVSVGEYEPEEDVRVTTFQDVA